MMNQTVQTIVRLKRAKLLEFGLKRLMNGDLLLPNTLTNRCNGEDQALMTRELGLITRSLVGTIMKSAWKLKNLMALQTVQAISGQQTSAKVRKINKKTTRRAMEVKKKMRRRSHQTMPKASQKDGITIAKKMMTHHPFLNGALTAHHLRSQMIPKSEDH